MSAKALSGDDECPPIDAETLRLYSMRFCPYSQRVRCVLAHKQIPHEVVNINLFVKPSWYPEKNPDATTPCLEHGAGNMVLESSIIADYLNSIFPGDNLFPDNPLIKARTGMAMAFAPKITGPYNVFMHGTPEALVEAKENLKEAFTRLENGIRGQFLSGDKVMMIDYHYWPWFERFILFPELFDYDPLPESEFPKLRAWCKNMMETPGVKATYHDPKIHIDYVKSLLVGQPEFDIGL